MLTNAGGPGDRDVDRRSMVESTHVQFRPEAAAAGRGVIGRLRQRFSEKRRG